MGTNSHFRDVLRLAPFSSCNSSLEHHQLPSPLSHCCTTAPCLPLASLFPFPDSKLPHRVQAVIFVPALPPQVVGIFLLLIHTSGTSHLIFFSADAGCAHPRERLKPQAAAAALGTGPLPATCCQLSQKTCICAEQTQRKGSNKGNFRGSFPPCFPNPNPGLPTESSCLVRQTSILNKTNF